MDDMDQFLSLHKSQLESSAVPQHLWKSLYKKLGSDIFDAGLAFQLMLIEYDEEVDERVHRPTFVLSVSHENGVKASDPDAIYLVDHAWTFRMNTARNQLEQHGQLAERLCGITGVDLEDGQRVEKLMQRLWRYVHCYSVSTPDGVMGDEARSPIWYFLDEVGSAVAHSDEPNCRLVPFFFANTQTTYSLLFLLRDVECEEQITRDLVEYAPKASLERDAFLLPWRDTDFRSNSIMQTEPHADYFTSGHLAETYPTYTDNMTPVVLQPNRNEPLKVFAEYEVVREHLTANAFQLVVDESVADVLWLTRHYKNFAEFASDSPQKFVNQFPFEYVITIKDLLSITARRAATEHHNTETLETYPRWLPTTYNLKTELVSFVSYYQQRADKGLDNHWIVKPWNLARSLDTHISSDIGQIMRLPVTGPKIVQKYIDRPVLFYRDELDAKVKFDIRYVILLKNVRPLEAYVYRQFFVRFANRSFSLSNFDEYEKHFTVMNYHSTAQLRHLKCADFLQLWQQQYPHIAWAAIEDDICAMLHELLVCATERAEPPSAIAPCAQSRALYAADIMLEWCDDEAAAEVHPKLLEVNWAPDCKRACDYYPDFFNDIFKLLFLDEPNNESFRLLGAST